MATVVESRIEFTYTPPISFVKFDLPGRFRAWKGVDFIIDEGGQWIWLEVTNYRYLRSRHKQLTEAVRKRFYLELLEKYLGTTSFLAHKGKFTCKPLMYAVILEVPQLDSALKSSVNDRLRGDVQPRGPWQSMIDVGVYDLAKWNEQFPEYAARRV